MRIAEIYRVIQKVKVSVIMRLRIHTNMCLVLTVWIFRPNCVGFLLVGLDEGEVYKIKVDNNLLRSVVARMYRVIQQER